MDNTFFTTHAELFNAYQEYDALSLALSYITNHGCQNARAIQNVLTQLGQLIEVLERAVNTIYNDYNSSA